MNSCTDTDGDTVVKIFDPPGGRNCPRAYSRRYETPGIPGFAVLAVVYPGCLLFRTAGCPTHPPVPVVSYAARTVRTLSSGAVGDVPSAGPRSDGGRGGATPAGQAPGPEGWPPLRAGRGVGGRAGREKSGRVSTRPVRRPAPGGGRGRRRRAGSGACGCTPPAGRGTASPTSGPEPRTSP